MPNQQKPKPNYLDLPKSFPPAWAIAYGQDNQGLWADLDIKSVSQRMRWIPSGWFLMGSPSSEKERFDSETQHGVTLSQGYWLADTACTQALWQALMRGNLSNFSTNNQNPVERVSWDDAQKFLKKLNQFAPQLTAQLPSEAQWEYACRAGTASAFSFGDNITPEQVNYDGDYPYADGKKGKNREQTVGVKALPANTWGLYQMHGNVWEWCQDWYGEYPHESVQDPQGQDTGEYRVLRGGSWINNGRHVRSADRDGYAPVYRRFSIGFRFSLRS